MTIDLMIRKFEKYVAITLMSMMAVVIFFGTLEVGYLIVIDLLSPPLFMLEVNEFLEIFGQFLLVLIGVELLETINSYHEDRTIRVEIVVIVAIIAIARKVITLDYKTLSSYTFFDVGAAVLFLAITFYLLKKARVSRKFEKPGGLETRLERVEKS